ncbi:MAG: LPS assembly protein LptD [Pseudomonadota bacterium]
MILRLLYPLLFAVLMFPLSARAQDLAALIADSIAVDPAGRVTASGNVQVFFQGTELNARSVSYSRTGDRLTITGPIRLTDADGTVLLADQAELSRDLREGVLVSARMVLDQQLQIAANEIARVNDRFTRLDRVVASSCEVCAANPTPVWEIRATRVIHDDLERQLYFENAQLRVIGIPVLYFPRLRLPDPSVDRASGFLVPDISSNSDLGTGLRLPYFFALNDHADITLTPYLAQNTRTLEFEYRHLFANGTITAEGAFSNDDLEGSRAFLFAYGEFQLARDYVLRTQIETVSDPGYLLTYDFGNQIDRLTNEVELTRVRDKDVFRSSISEFRTLRDTEIPIRDTLPDQFIELFYQRDVPELSFGGRTFVSVGGASLRRPSSEDVLGRDVSRISIGADWRKDWVLQNGIVTAAELGLRADAYSVGQDSNFATNFTRTVPRGAAELRWPMARTTSDGGTEVLEPILRIDISDDGGDQPPIEDSTVIEFDEANLFSPSRFPGVDGVETGVRVAVGAQWRRSDPSGWDMDLALGRVANLDGDLGFGEGSGLEGDQSEWLLSGRLNYRDNLQLISRSLFDTDIQFTLSETRLDWRKDSFQLSTSYIFAEPEPSEAREDRLSEWSLNGRYRFDNNWAASAGWRYDFNADRAARTAVGLDYRSECIDVELSLSRRFADSTTVDPATEFSFSVSLTGIGGRERQSGSQRNCRG